MFRSERDFTRRASKIKFEEAYFGDNLITSNNTFLLRYPELFSCDKSLDKSIGVRRVQVNPFSDYVKFWITYDPPGSALGGESGRCKVDVLPDNTMIEILGYMLEQLKKEGMNVEIKCGFDEITGELSLCLIDPTALPGTDNRVDFCLMFDDDYDEKCFWSFFNQPAPVVKSGQFVKQIDLHNVWGRHKLYVHSSFSNSHKKYLCLTNDFWDTPNKIYKDNVHGVDCNIWFTTDGIHRIFPVTSNILIELSFVLRTRLEKNI